MTFISFAQNLEDVMLYRALKHLETGFYIDVGAHDPVTCSVTKAFYDRGWRGINIEPTPEFHAKLKRERPRDTNLQIAASNAHGVLRFYEVSETGLSTTEPEIARRHADTGFDVREYEVACRRLDDVCNELDVGEIHFLKIDVEGAEALVLEGISLERVRPWIVVVEATEPMTQTPTHDRWEHILTDRGYGFVYFDGLNRFYISNEHSELTNSFGAPPNVFDEYVRYLELPAAIPVKGPIYRLRKNTRRYIRYLKTIGTRAKDR